MACEAFMKFVGPEQKIPHLPNYSPSNLIQCFLDVRSIHGSQYIYRQLRKKIAGAVKVCEQDPLHLIRQALQDYSCELHKKPM